MIPFKYQFPQYQSHSSTRGSIRDTSVSAPLWHHLHSAAGLIIDNCQLLQATPTAWQSGGKIPTCRWQHQLVMLLRDGVCECQAVSVSSGGFFLYKCAFIEGDGAIGM